MSTFALLNEYLTINSVALSDHTRAATVNASAAQLDASAMGDGWFVNKGGMKSGTLAVEVLDDFASSSIDETLWSAFDTGTAVAAAVRPENTTIGSTNPEYQFDILPNQWSMGGSLGEMAGKSLTYPITGAITRDVSA